MTQPICMVTQPPFKSKYINQHSSNDKNFSELKELFTRVQKIPNDHKVTHLHSPFKPVQAKKRRVPPHLLSVLNEELKRMETESHTIKLEKYDEDCFICPVVFTRKKDG